MKSFTISEYQDLEAVLATFGPDALYRGQTNQYGPDDAPIMNTSFSRVGCVPPQTLRWTHYARFILAALLDRDASDVTLEFSQAILQHYGWRSFYLDASSEPSVSAWFAANSFSSRMSLEMCEDCFEDPVLIRKLAAKYTHDPEGDGFLYVLSKERMQQCGLALVDLSSIDLGEHRPRFHAQQAWLVGPLHGDLPVECIEATIKAPKGLLAAYAKTKGLSQTSDLFPSAEEDPVLQLLATMPWKRIRFPGEEDAPMKIFAQPFEFPEYHVSFRKRQPPIVAFYEGGDLTTGADLPDVKFFDVPELVVYGSADIGSMKFPQVHKLINGEGKHFIFEIDNLVRRPGPLTSEYLKGLALSKLENGLVAVADFAVDHPGLQIGGFGINAGWHYRVASDGSWNREVSPEDCTCGNNSIHMHHISMLTILEDALRNDRGSITSRAMAS